MSQAAPDNLKVEADILIEELVARSSQSRAPCARARSTARRRLGSASALDRVRRSSPRTRCSSASQIRSPPRPMTSKNAVVVVKDEIGCPCESTMAIPR